MAKSGSSTVQYNLENVLKQTMRLQKEKRKKALLIYNSKHQSG